MPESLCKIVFSGRPQPGRDEDEMTDIIARAFKISGDEVRRRFIGKTVIIKSGIDMETAGKYQAVLEKAGAEYRILPMDEELSSDEPDQEEKTPEEKAPGETEQREVEEQESDFQETSYEDSKPAQSEPDEVKATDESPAGFQMQKAVPRVIHVSPKPVSLQYDPLPCRAITSVEGGMNFNRYGSEHVAYNELLLVSVYNLPSGTKSKTKVMIFLGKQKKSLIVEASSIAFEGFRGIKDDDLYMSLRNFVQMLLNMKPDILVDEPTAAFLEGGSPELYKKEETARSSTIGAALDAENLFQLQAQMTVQPKKQEVKPIILTPVEPFPEEKRGSGKGIAIGAVALIVVAAVVFSVMTLLKKKPDETAKKPSTVVAPAPPARVVTEPPSANQGQQPTGPGQTGAIPQPDVAAELPADLIAKDELMKACSAARYFFSGKPDMILTSDLLRANGYVSPEGIEIQIISPTKENLILTGRHVQGSRLYSTGPECKMQ